MSLNIYQTLYAAFCFSQRSIKPARRIIAQASVLEKSAANRKVLERRLDTWHARLIAKLWIIWLKCAECRPPSIGSHLRRDFFCCQSIPIRNPVRRYRQTSSDRYRVAANEKANRHFDRPWPSPGTRPTQLAKTRRISRREKNNGDPLRTSFPCAKGEWAKVVNRVRVLTRFTFSRARPVPDTECSARVRDNKGGFMPLALRQSTISSEWSERKRSA